MEVVLAVLPALELVEDSLREGPGREKGDLILYI
jgi:hypothetical protein